MTRVGEEGGVIRGEREGGVLKREEQVGYPVLKWVMESGQEGGGGGGGGR